MFIRDQEHLIAICRALMGRIGRADLCDEKGPTDEAFRVHRSGVLSGGETVMLGIALDLWNGGGSVQFMDLFRVDDNHRRSVSVLLASLATSESMVDLWIDANTEGRAA